MRAVVLGLLFALLAGCAPEPPGSPIRVAHPGSLDGTAWQIVAIGGQSTDAAPPMLLSFDAGTGVSGSGPCNGIGGGYRYDKASGALGVTGLVSTKRACLDANSNRLEAAYFAGLRGAADASIDPEGRLVIAGAGPELRFSAAGRAFPVPMQSQAGPS